MQVNSHLVKIRMFPLRRACKFRPCVRLTLCSVHCSLPAKSRFRVPCGNRKKETIQFMSCFVLAEREGRIRRKHAWLADDVAPAMHVDSARVIAPPEKSTTSGTGRVDVSSHLSTASHDIEQQRKGLLLIVASLLTVVSSPRSCASSIYAMWTSCPFLEASRGLIY